jgi:septum formation protein
MHAYSPLLILGSTSRYRKALLERLQLEFEICAPGTVEDPLPQESAEHLALRLARAKAHDVAAKMHARRQEKRAIWIIGSDQAAVREDALGQFTLVGKPDTKENAIAQLLASSGKTLVFNTAVCLLELHSGREQLANIPVKAKYRTLDIVTIEQYLAKESALDCAGSVKSEGLGIALLESCSSDDPTALVGLPLITVCTMLRQWGWKLP